MKIESITIMNEFLQDLRKHEVESDATNSTMLAYIDMLKKMNEMFLATKDKQAFAMLMRDISDLIYKNVLNPYDKIKSRGISPGTNKPSSSRKSPSSLNLQDELGLVGIDLQEIPKSERSKISELLVMLGLPAEEINKQLGL